MEPSRSVTSEHDKLEAILSRLELVRKLGDGYRARCPAHEKGRDRDLKIAAGYRGIVLYCHAGCSTETVLHAIDLRYADLFYDSNAPAARVKRRDWRAIELEAMTCAVTLQESPDVLERLRFTRGWAAKALHLLDVGWDGRRLTLPVRDADGKLHDVLLYDPFATTGRKMIQGKGKSRLPWPAPESIEGDTVILVEGEGTAISMKSIGLPAVSLPGSIGKPTGNVYAPGSWRGGGWHRTWVKRFERFRFVVCFPDLDDVGRALMRAVRYDLEKSGINVSIVDLGPKTHDGSDIADMLLKGTYDRPRRLIARNIIREIIAEQAEVLVA